MAELNKTDLKAIFKAGAIPTEAQFADLIESQINTKETASLNETGSTQLVPASGFFNLRGTQPFIGLVTENSTTGSGISIHAGFGSDLSLGELPNNPFFKLNNGVDFFMDNSDSYTNSQFRIFKNTSLPNISPSFELLRLNDDGGLLITGSLTSSGDINITGSITCSIISASGTIIADTFQSSTTTLSVNDSLDVTGNITASGNISASSAVLTGNITASGAISASGNLVVGGTSTLNGDITIPKSVKLYLDGPSGLHVYSEGTATDENQIILAKTNNLRILNQAHGKDIIFGTENASGTAKTPLTLSGSGDALFGGIITGVSASLEHISASGDITSRTANFPTSVTTNALTITGTNGISLANNAKIKSTNTATTFIELSTDDFWNINANGINVAKLSSAGLTVNEAGAASCDFRVEGDSDTHLIFADASADKVAIGTSTVGTSLLTVDGDVTLTNITASGNISSSGNIYADRYYSNGQLALLDVNSTITIGYDNTYPINIGKSANPITLLGQVTASGAISASRIDTTGTLDLNAGDNITLDAADDIVLTTTSADGEIQIVSAHTSGVAFHLDANADAASEVQIDAGVLDIDVTAAATIDAVGVAIGAGSGELDLTTTGTMDVNAAALDIDASAAVTIDSVGLSIDNAGVAANITSTTDGAAEDFTIALAGATDSSLILSSTGTGADALQISTSAGSLDIDSADNITLDAADDIVLTTTSADGEIQIVSAHTAGRALFIDANAAVTSEVDIDAGTLDIDSAGNTTIDAGGSIGLTAASTASISSTLNAGASILLHANGGTSETIKIHSDQGTSTTEGAASVQLLSDAGGIGIKSTADSAGAIRITADGGTNETIMIHADQGTSTSAITLLSDAGGIMLSGTKGVKSKIANGIAAGGGIDAVSPEIQVGKYNGEIVTTIFIDIGAGSIVSGTDTGDVIGEDGVANAYVTQITSAKNGIVYKGEIVCLEVPTTGDPDINVAANSSGTIAEDAGGEGQHVLANCGTHTLALKTDFTIPAGGIQDDFIYLTHGGTTAGTYDAGKFYIRFYGVSALGL